MDILIPCLLFLLAGVGLGTFVIGSFIRRIETEVVSAVKNELVKAHSLATEAENALKAARKALP